ncbi:FAD binding domain-containing protein [bacterium]|nr:FAD binding domain-containing protein [bacterium]MBU1983964.1 FAD binding domain-containing protein [bacterium]
MRILFYLNGDFVEAEVRVGQTALDFLREERGLTGAKEACNEGDCGACVIALGELIHDSVRYRAFNSCLLPAVRLHGKHVVSVEGLIEHNALHPVQQAMLEEHAVQCGFCTSGIVMSLFCLFLANPTPTPGEIARALDGSLCRCTGYAPILKAAYSISSRCGHNTDFGKRIRPAYFDSIGRKALEAIASVPTFSNEAVYHAPRTVADLLSLLSSNGSSPVPTLLNGGTDLMVEVNQGKRAIETVIDISFMKDLREIAHNDAHLSIGARTTLTDVLESQIVCERFPALAEAIRQMCSTPVRNGATLIGNICTASPIADTIPPLLVYNAIVNLESTRGKRRIPLKDFFQGYRKTAIERGEIVTAVEVPFDECLSSFEKTSKRKTLDIASVNSALALQVSNNIITHACYVLGGVAAVPFLAEKSCDYLNGKEPSEGTIAEAARIAADEITPIDDVRGSAEFRRELAANHLIKHFVKLMPSLFA